MSDERRTRGRLGTVSAVLGVLTASAATFSACGTSQSPPTSAPCPTAGEAIVGDPSGVLLAEAYRVHAPTPAELRFAVAYLSVLAYGLKTGETPVVLQTPGVRKAIATLNGEYASLAPQCAGATSSATGQTSSGLISNPPRCSDNCLPDIGPIEKALADLASKLVTWETSLTGIALSLVTELAQTVNNADTVANAIVQGTDILSTSIGSFSDQDITTSAYRLGTLFLDAKAIGDAAISLKVPATFVGQLGALLGVTIASFKLGYSIGTAFDQFQSCHSWQVSACADAGPDAADAGDCQPTTCLGGCCDSQGVCLPGTANTACGSGGQGCALCNSPQTCESSRCGCPSGGTLCGSLCCDADAGQVCGNAAKSLCCAADATACGSTCCDPGDGAQSPVCVNPATGLCCAADAVCGNICCAAGLVCADSAKSLCCAPGDSACGSTCCGAADFCANSATGLCCATGEVACSTGCCSPDAGPNGSDAGSCDPGAVPCGSVSCNAATQVCCVAVGHGPTCTALAACTGTALQCNEAADCTTGVCCTSASGSTSCMSSCPGGYSELSCPQMTGG